MYIDDGTDQHANELEVNVDGHEYDAEANVDLNHEGVVDAVLVNTDDGYTVYADSDGDGVADTYAELDKGGEVTREARFDEGSEEWVASDGRGGSDTDSQANMDSGHSVHIDGPHGGQDAGKPTIDTDHDGKPDTAVVDDGHGGRILATDSDGDGEADVLTQVSGDGKVATSEHTGDGEWRVTERGHLDDQGKYHRDSGGGGEATHAIKDPASDEVWGGSGGSGLADGVARIDTATGQWISRN